MSLGVEMFVDPVFAGSGWIVGNDRNGAFVGNGLSQAVAVSVGQDDFGGQAFDQGIGLRRIALLAGREREADRTSKPRTALWILVLRPPRERPPAAEAAAEQAQHCRRSRLLLVHRFGQTGPKAQRASHDLTYLARNGVLSLGGGPNGPPVPR